MSQGEIQFMRLPALQANRLMDFSGVTNALSDFDKRVQYREKMDVEAEERSYQRGRDARSDQRQQVELFGKQAAAVSKIEDPQRRAAIWGRLVSKHADYQNLDKAYLDPTTGPQMVMAEAGQWTDPLDAEQKRLGIDKTRAEITQLGQKNALETAIADMIKGGGDQPVPSPSLVQPQSYSPQQQNMLRPVQPMGQQGAVQSQNRLLQLAADRVVPVDQPSTTPQSAPRQPDMVDTPLGRMTIEDARRKALGLALAGKGDAGKMILGEGAGALEKTARTEVDKRELAQTEGLGRIRDIRTTFRPEYLTFQTQIGMWGKSLAAKAGQLNPKDQQSLYKYATFRRDAANNMNQAIRDNSGMTVTDQEMKRNQVEYANAGTGVFDGDDPVTFKAKLDRAEEVLALGIARNRYLRTKGFNGDVNAAANQIPIEKMRQVINQRAAQIEQEVRTQAPGIDPAMLGQEVDFRIKQEFGI